MTKTADGRGPRTQGPCAWLTICCSLTCFMLLADRLGFSAPRGLIYWFNPVAWFCNAIGLTARLGGFVRGMDQGVARMGSIVGLPVIGSFVLYYLFGLARWRWPVLVFLFFIVPFLCAMQLSTARAYERLADRFHDQGQVERETRALSKALYVLQRAHAPDSEAARLQARLKPLSTQSAPNLESKVDVR